MSVRVITNATAVGFPLGVPEDCGDDTRLGGQSLRRKLTQQRAADEAAYLLAHDCPKSASESIATLMACSSGGEMWTHWWSSFVAVQQRRNPTCDFCGREIDGGYVVHRVIRGQFQEIDLECGCTEETDALDQDIEELGCALGEDSVST